MSSTQAGYIQTRSELSLGNILSPYYLRPSRLHRSASEIDGSGGNWSSTSDLPRPRRAVACRRQQMKIVLITISTIEGREAELEWQRDAAAAAANHI